MKTPLWFFALAVALATLGYVIFTTVSPRAGALPPAPDPLALQLKQAERLIGDVGTTVENLDTTLKAAPGLGERSGQDVAELMRLVGELTALNRAQQDTIRQLTAPAPQPAKSVVLENTVTLVGVASTLLTMLLAWRQDRRAIDELRLKLAEAGAARPKPAA